MGHTFLKPRAMSTASKTVPLDSKQFDLFGATQAPDARPRPCASDTGRRFITGNAQEIILGTTRLEDWLKQAGQRAPFVVARLLEQQDWQAFELHYAGTGRAPYCPRQMMGLILYGVMQGIHLLRGLERLARLDLGCMWVTGGITPDHANIGRFITLHGDLLTQAFFESLTRAILKASGSASTRLAGDGTVIEAACSRYNLLKEEAVRERVQAATAALEHAPDDRAAQKEQQRSAQCESIFNERLVARQRHGKGMQSLRISAIEPEAMVQRLKRGQGYGASYKPSVLANSSRIITALAVDASSETRVVASMLDQSARITGTQAKEVLLDAGYFDDSVIEATLARDVSLLCPEGQWPSKATETDLFHKSAFKYDAQTDTYRCPAGQILTRETSARKTMNTREHRVYGAGTCGDCPLRAKCTKAAQGRRIKRYPEDEQREALRVVMQHPQARRVFSQRKAIVEPVFSSLRCQQGLNRFRRRGLAAVSRGLRCT
ncbi:transposase [Azotobacter sp. CWF10]